MLDQELSDGRHIVADPPPTHPTFHAQRAMSQTTVQVSCASQLTDASFDAIAEALRRPEPGLLLMLATAIGFVAGLGQADPAHAQGSRLLFVAGGVNAAITTDFLGRFAEQLAMMLHTGDQELRFVWVAYQQAIFADQAAVDFAVPDLAPELGIFRFGFAAANDGGMRFKQAQHFVTGRGGQ